MLIPTQSSWSQEIHSNDLIQRLNWIRFELVQGRIITRDTRQGQSRSATATNENKKIREEVTLKIVGGTPLFQYRYQDPNQTIQIELINNNHLVIIGVPEHGNVTLVSDTELEGQPLQMMKEGDSLVIISAINSWNIHSDDPLRSIMQTGDGNWRSSNLVKYTVIDITNRSDPNVGREIFIEGSHETARMVNGTVRSVSHLSLIHI